MDTLGDGNGSVLFDVAIINDTLAYAVGDLNFRDSLGNFTSPYGLAIWNGKKWKAMRIYATGPTGSVSNLVPRGIFAFSASDVWFASGGVFRWNGDSAATPFWINSFPGNPNPILLPGQTAEKLWGTSSQSLYAVGRQGAIAYYNGITWLRLNTGTTVDLQDIWGSAAGGGMEILALASNSISFPGAKQVFQINGTSVVAVADTGLPLPLEGVWFFSKKQYWIVGDGAYQTDLIGKIWQEDPRERSFYRFAIRGLATNDIVAVGGYGGIAHYNGLSWKAYAGNEVMTFFGNYYSVALHPKLAVAVGGYEGRKAIILVGKR